MKRAIIALVVLALVVPGTSAFAAEPATPEVYQAVGYVFAMYSLAVMSTAYGQTYPGLEVRNTDSSGDLTVVFSNFATSSLEGFMGATSADLSYATLDGTVKVDSEGRLDLDVKLTGGSVGSLKMIVEGDSVVSLRADGRDYTFTADLQPPF